MANEHYQNIKNCVLSDYLPAEIFRTILPDQREIIRGITELPVEIEFKRKNKRLLSFEVPWDGMVYGYVRGKEALCERLELGKDIKLISLTDWDDKFVLVFETGDDRDTRAFYVTTQEVVELLENCRRVPEQRLQKPEQKKQ